MTRTTAKCVAAGAIAGFGVWAINAGPAVGDAVDAAKAQAVDVVNGWAKSIEKAATEVGWKVTIIDGRNSPKVDERQ
jgi:hypothetical protein